MPKKSIASPEKAIPDNTQYRAIKIIGLWLAAAIPFTVLVAAVVPALSRATGGSEILWYWSLLPLNAAWLTGLSLWIIRREEGNLRWETVRNRIWLDLPQDPKTEKPVTRLNFRILLSLIAAGIALILGLIIPSIGAAILYIVPFPSFTNLSEVGSPEFARAWGWFAAVVIIWVANTFIAEELLFRGILLPRMKGAFGRLDGFVNACLYGLYYLSAPLLIPFRWITGLVAAVLAGRYRSNRLAPLVRGVEGAAIVIFAWAGIQSPQLAALRTPLALPRLGSGGTSAETGNTIVLSSIPAYIPNSGNTMQVDLRSSDLSALDLRQNGDDLAHACFDSRTVWPSAERMPTGVDPQQIMEWGKNPGLGLRELHARGITGRGVGIAIIDQGLLLGHREYADRLMWYEEITHNPFNNDASMHGGAVASIAVGKTAGVAPEAGLFFFALNDMLFRDMFWQMHYYALGVRRVIQLNKFLPEDRKIRVISISIGSNPPGMSGSGDFSAAMREAEAAGIGTIFSYKTPSGFIDLAGLPISADPDRAESYDLSILAQAEYGDSPNFLLIPVDSRTLAAPTGNDDYFFCRAGGLSWLMPYSAGLYALAAQVDPSITLNRFWELAFQTAQPIQVSHEGTIYHIGKMINPEALIAALQTGQ
jgi:membrane protease YdiL (CAAX protease family)